MPPPTSIKSHQSLLISNRLTSVKIFFFSPFFFFFWNYAFHCADPTRLIKRIADVTAGGSCLGFEQPFGAPDVALLSRMLGRTLEWTGLELADNLRPKIAGFALDPLKICYCLLSKVSRSEVLCLKKLYLTEIARQKGLKLKNKKQLSSNILCLPSFLQSLSKSTFPQHIESLLHCFNFSFSIIFMLFT